MDRYLCQLCYTIVQYGERHPCIFYMDDDKVYTVPQPDETIEVDTIHDETTGEYAENLDDNYWDMFETSQHIRKTSQASTSLVTEGKQEDDEMSRDFADCPVQTHASLHAGHSQTEMDAEEMQPIELKQDESARPGPSAIRPGGEAQYACVVCTHRSKKKSNFVRHYRTHTGEKPYDCDICGKKFALRNDLNVHQRTHSDEKPFDCDICGKKFNCKGNLNKHLRTDTGEKPFVCGTCGKSFTQKQYLNSHVRTHTGEKPFSCDICGRRFSEKNNCRRHVATHDGKESLTKRFVCDTCGKGFFQKGNLFSFEKAQWRKTL